MKLGPKNALLAAAMLAAATAPAQAAKWDMPLAYPAGNYHSQNAAEFGKCVAGATGGKIDVVTHPNGSLFKGNDIKRAVQTGQAPIGERLLSAHQNESALFGIDSQPFLATSFDDAERLWSFARPAIEKLLDGQNLVYLYSVAWPPQGLYFKKPVESVADMKGVKFRAYNATTARMAELTGMIPTQVEAAELTQAFSTNVVQSMISSGATGFDSKLWEHTTHFYEVDAWLPRNTVFANKEAWSKLDAASQKAIKDCAEKARVDGLRRAREYTAYTLDGLRKGGMKVGPASAKLKAELKEVGAKMSADWLSKAGPQGKAIVDKFNGK